LTTAATRAYIASDAIAPHGIARRPGRRSGGTEEEIVTGADLSITIDRRVEDVFAVLTDVEKTRLWSADAEEEHMTTDPPVGVGSTRHAVGRMLGRRMENDAEVTAFEPNRAWTMKSLTGPSWEASATFRAVDGGTRVDFSWSFGLGGALALFRPLLMIMFRRRFSADLRRLKDLMESGAL
jgi:uncharacterized protein YndB with AHSA1/START domain